MRLVQIFILLNTPFWKIKFVMYLQWRSKSDSEVGFWIQATQNEKNDLFICQPMIFNVEVQGADYNTDVLTAITPLTWILYAQIDTLTPLSSNFQNSFQIISDYRNEPIVLKLKLTQDPAHARIKTIIYILKKIQSVVHIDLPPIG